MIKFKGHISMKEYIKNRLIRWGFKFWLGCNTISGYIFEFDISTGQKDAPELGLGKKVVLDVTKNLHGIGISVFADNYFSSPTLAALLRDRGMNFIGVARKIEKACLPSRTIKSYRLVRMKCSIARKKI